MQATVTQGLEIMGRRIADPVTRTSVGPRMTRGTVHVVTSLVALFLLFDGAGRLVGFGPYVQGTIQAGYGAHQAPVIAVALLVPMILYLIPRTAILGAVLATGYLGGAVATNLRVMGGSPWIVFPIVLGALLWADLWLRDPRVRAALDRPR